MLLWVCARCCGCVHACCISNKKKLTSPEPTSAKKNGRACCCACMRADGRVYRRAAGRCACVLCVLCLLLCMLRLLCLLLCVLCVWLCVCAAVRVHRCACAPLCVLCVLCGHAASKKKELTSPGIEPTSKKKIKPWCKKNTAQGGVRTHECEHTRT